MSCCCVSKKDNDTNGSSNGADGGKSRSKDSVSKNSASSKDDSSHSKSNAMGQALQHTTNELAMSNDIELTMSNEQTPPCSPPCNFKRMNSAAESFLSASSEPQGSGAEEFNNANERREFESTTEVDIDLHDISSDGKSPNIVKHNISMQPAQHQDGLRPGVIEICKEQDPDSEVLNVSNSKEKSSPSKKLLASSRDHLGDGHTPALSSSKERAGRMGAVKQVSKNISAKLLSVSKSPSKNINRVSEMSSKPGEGGENEICKSDVDSADEILENLGMSRKSDTDPTSGTDNTDTTGGGKKKRRLLRSLKSAIKKKLNRRKKRRMTADEQKRNEDVKNAMEKKKEKSTSIIKT